MQAQQLLELMAAGGFWDPSSKRPPTKPEREAFAGALEVDESSVRRWLAGGTVSARSLERMRDIRAAGATREALAAFWQAYDASAPSAPPAAPLPVAPPAVPGAAPLSGGAAPVAASGAAHAPSGPGARRWHSRLPALCGACALGFSVLAVAVAVRTTPEAFPVQAWTLAPVEAPELIPVDDQVMAPDSRNIAGALAGRTVPEQPLPGQMVPPCLQADEAINGSCWFPGKAVAPCPEGSYEYAGRCYVPRQARPRKPVPKPSDGGW